jgi:hypothetical protein
MSAERLPAIRNISIATAEITEAIDIVAKIVLTVSRVIAIALPQPCCLIPHNKTLTFAVIGNPLLVS